MPHHTDETNDAEHGIKDQNENNQSSDCTPETRPYSGSNEWDAITQAAKLSKVSQKTNPVQTTLIWVMGSVVLLSLVWWLSSHHGSTAQSTPPVTYASTDFHSSLSANNAYLNQHGEQQTEATGVVHEFPIFNDTKRMQTKAELARQNAPTSMYSDNHFNAGNSVANVVTNGARYKRPLQGRVPIQVLATPTHPPLQ